jgi:hypothetical protein
MKKNHFLEFTASPEGEKIIAQQLQESYQSGVIDHDLEVEEGYNNQD